MAEWVSNEKSQLCETRSHEMFRNLRFFTSLLATTTPQPHLFVPTVSSVQNEGAYTLMLSRSESCYVTSCHAITSCSCAICSLKSPLPLSRTVTRYQGQRYQVTQYCRLYSPEESIILLLLTIAPDGPDWMNEVQPFLFKKLNLNW